MFTGIIQGVGQISEIHLQNGDRRLHIAAEGQFMSGVQPGDSVAVNGVCLTVVRLDDAVFTADVSSETLACTTLGTFRPGLRVNLEKSLTLGTPLGGHLVSGHVDGVGEIVTRTPDARSMRFRIRLPSSLSRYVAAKGSICLDGASLTVNSVAGDEFDINLVPHTLEVTTLSGWQPGSRINVEVDLVARYLERLMTSMQPEGGTSAINREFLGQHGYLK